MKLLTRIIACSLAVVITFSAYAAPQANASLVGDIIVSYSRSSLAQWTLSVALDTAGTIVYGPIGGLAGQAIAAGVNDLAAYYAAGYTDDDILAAEQVYIDDLPSGLSASNEGVFAYGNGAGFATDEESNAGAIEFWKSFDLYSAANSAPVGSFMPFSGNNYHVVVGFGIQKNTLFDCNVLMCKGDQFMNGYAPYDMNTLSLQTFCSFDFFTTTETNRSYTGYSSTFDNYPWMLFLNYQDAYDAFLSGKATKYNIHYLLPETWLEVYWVPAQTSYAFVFKLHDYGTIELSTGKKDQVSMSPAVFRCEYSGNGSSAAINWPLVPSKVDVTDQITPSTRFASSAQAIHNYNSNNTSNTYNFYLAPAGSEPTADTVISPAVYDEETLVFTEPVTGAQYQTTGWTYDYVTRTYDIALDAGTFKIGESDVTQIISTYGDDAATITYYDAAGAELAADEYSYVIASSKEADDSDDPGTGDHKHSYTDQITKDPGCTLPGVRTYTCGCGDSYTKSVPATGHDWAIGTQVNASYDPATGELLQAGYVIYSCSTCGQQYKDDSNTGPPSSGSSGSSGEDGLFGKLGELLGTAGSGVLDLISSAIGKLLDGAIALLEMAFEKLGRVVEILLSLFDAVPQLFGGYLDMFGAVFAFIPEDIITLLTFGVACVIILGIWKMTRR